MLVRTSSKNAQLYERIDVKDNEEDKYDYLYENCFVKEINKLNLEFSSDYGNELYIYYLIRNLETSFFEKRNLDIGSSNRLGSSTLEIAVAFICSIFVFPLILLSPLLVLLEIIHRGCAANMDNVDLSNKEICVLRSIATQEKIAKLDNIFTIHEGISYGRRAEQKLVNFVTLFQMCTIFVNIPFKLVKEYFGLYQDIRKFFPFGQRFSIWKYFAPRVISKSLYEKLLEKLIINIRPSSLITGNKEDRFAVVENKVCASLSIKLTCIPHGIEYAYKFPLGLAGDEFYCSSEAACVYLSALYDSDKFLYDADLNRKIYTETCLGNFQLSQTVFFTEPRDIDINIKILGDLLAFGIDFLVKLHPNDTRANYKSLVGLRYIDIITSFDGMVCVARKSTILIEASYNGGHSVAYITNAKDRYYVRHLFPSLFSKSITYVEDINALGAFILSART